MTWVDQRSSVGSYLNSTSAQIASYLNTTGTAIGNTTWVEQAQVRARALGTAKLLTAAKLQRWALLPCPFMRASTCHLSPTPALLPQAITANIAANITSPILDLIPPKDVQAQALGFLAEDAAALAYAA